MELGKTLVRRTRLASFTLTMSLATHILAWSREIESFRADGLDSELVSGHGALSQEE